MTTRKDIIGQIEELLGTEGSTELATALLPILEREGLVTFDAYNGYLLLLEDAEDYDNRAFNELVMKAEATLIERKDTDNE